MYSAMWRLSAFFFLLVIFIIFFVSKPKQRIKLRKYMFCFIGFTGLSVAGLLHYDAFYRPKVGPLGDRIPTQEYLVGLTILIGTSLLSLLYGIILFFIEQRKHKRGH